MSAPPCYFHPANSTTGNSDVLEQSADLQRIWGQKGELKNQLIALSTPRHYEESLLGFSHFAHNYNGFVPSNTSRRTWGVGLSPVPATLDSFYTTHSPNHGYQITSVQSLDTESFNISSDTVSPPLSSNFEDYPSYKALPSYTEDDMEK